MGDHQAEVLDGIEDIDEGRWFGELDRTKGRARVREDDQIELGAQPVDR
jgi:hypothetical protein